MAPKSVSTGYIFSLLMSLGILSCAVIIGTVYWLAERVNEAENTGTRKIVALTVAENAHALEILVADYSYWDLAYDIVAADDVEAIYDNIGSGATESNAFDELHILSAMGTPLHVFGSQIDESSPVRLDTEVLSNIISDLTTSADDSYLQLSFVTVQDGAAMLVSMAKILPDDLSRLRGVPASLMLGVKYLDPILLGTATLKELAPDLMFSQAEPSQDILSQSMFGYDGRSIGTLTWTAQNKGTELAWKVAPGIAITCIAILLICLSAARHFEVQNAGLSRAIRLAETDQLTGLHNRAGLNAILGSPEATDALDQNRLAVLTMDLNDFKALNDTYGHDAGDLALVHFTQCLRQCTRRTDILVRLGGDEFVCLVIDDAPEMAARQIAERLAQGGLSAVQIGSTKVPLSASIGIAVPKDNRDRHYANLAILSDQAMYAAKQNLKTQRTRGESATVSWQFA